jgi:hypothetical protein
MTARKSRKRPAPVRDEPKTHARIIPPGDAKMLHELARKSDDLALEAQRANASAQAARIEFEQFKTKLTRLYMLAPNDGITEDGKVFKVPQGGAS